MKCLATSVKYEVSSKNRESTSEFVLISAFSKFALDKPPFEC